MPNLRYDGPAGILWHDLVAEGAVPGPPEPGAVIHVSPAFARSVKGHEWWSKVAKDDAPDDPADDEAGDPAVDDATSVEEGDEP